MKDKNDPLFKEAMTAFKKHMFTTEKTLWFGDGNGGRFNIVLFFEKFLVFIIVMTIILLFFKEKFLGGEPVGVFFFGLIVFGLFLNPLAALLRPRYIAVTDRKILIYTKGLTDGVFQELSYLQLYKVFTIGDSTLIILRYEGSPVIIRAKDFAERERVYEAVCTGMEKHVRITQNK